MEDEEEKANPGAGKEGKDTAIQDRHGTDAGLFSLSVGVGLFFFLPLFAATQFFDVSQCRFEFNIVSGAIRITILLTYLYAISKMKDVHRLFQYHGAEHKAVFAFETECSANRPVSDHVYPLHRRGTSFVLQVMLIAILLFSVMDTILLQFIDELTLPIRLLTHIPFIPVLGGISYEFLKFSAKHSNTTLGKMFVAPGLWLQRSPLKNRMSP